MAYLGEDRALTWCHDIANISTTVFLNESNLKLSSIDHEKEFGCSRMSVGCIHAAWSKGGLASWNSTKNAIIAYSRKRDQKLK